jgi:hypothetical protein
MPPVRLRERIGAIGCAGFALLLTPIFFLVTSLDTFQGRTQSPVRWIFLVVFLVIAAGGFAVGLRPGEDEDGDPFHGDRGVAVAMALLVIVLVVVVFAALLLNPGFWAGLMEP